MKLKDFHIGLDFWCGGKRWRCTDVGTRVIVAISLEPHEVVSIGPDPNDPTKRLERRYMTDDPSWLIGPTYAVAEDVFDEDSLPVCRLTEFETDDDESLFESVRPLPRSAGKRRDPSSK